MNLIDRTWGDWEEIRGRFRWAVPPRFNIGYDVCDKHVGLRGRIALWYENAAGEERTFTFGLMRSLSNRFANVLKELGIQPGDRVGIILPQRAETAIAHLAVYKTGAVALPLSVLFGPDALEYRLRDSATRLVVTDADRRLILEAIRDRLPDLQEVIVCGGDHAGISFWHVLEKASDRFDPIQSRSEDPALLIYTSGTTGPPKGALHAHRVLLGHLTGFEMSHNCFPRQGDRFWTPADWAWAGGLLDGLLPSWHYGKPILAYEGGKFDPEKAFYLLEKYRIRNAFIPPTAMKMMMQVPRIRDRFKIRLRSIMSAGEAVGSEVIGWAQEHLGITVNEMWGQTEVNYLVGNCHAVMAVKPGSIGKPYPGHDVDVIDEQGRPMPAGDVGELACRRGDPVMFLGYWNQPEATAAKFTGDWFTTGDLGSRDRDGYFWFMGRKDDLITSAGYRIGPGEIEDCLLKHPAVAQAAVIGVPDVLRGSIIKAFIVPAPSFSPSAALVEEIQLHVRARLAAYEYPREIEFIDELPLTTTGKIRRVELRRLEMERRRNSEPPKPAGG
jgi:acetyl-CoA synthetase